MKKGLLILFFIIPFLLSFKNINEKLLTLCKDIIDNPEKIYDLKNNYPDYYKDEYINISTKDINNLKFVYNIIDSLFNKNIDSLLEYNSQNSSIDIKVMPKDRYKLNYYNVINQEIRDRINIYEIKFHNGDNAVQFQFIVDNNVFYLYNIRNISQ